MSIGHTRALLRAALDGSLAQVDFVKDPFFGLMVPKAVPGIPSHVLSPREGWADKAAYDRTAAELVARFEVNFEGFAGAVGDDVRAVAIKTAA
jgi:phosphoenolpyruvate carboxykinase (ATP)